MGASAFGFGLEHGLGNVRVYGVVVATVRFGKVVLLEQDVYSLLNTKTGARFAKKF